MEIALLIAVAIAAAVGIVFGYLLFERHRARYKLETYSRPAGARPLTSFVCPDCLHRSYAAEHIRNRFCQNCDKSFPPRGAGKESA